MSVTVHLVLAEASLISYKSKFIKSRYSVELKSCSVDLV